MTRVNSGISTNSLTDQHLIAELREIPRIVTAVKKRISSGKGFKDIPNSFMLGNGHVKFFYDKLSYIYNRHKKLRDEYYNRFEKEWKYNIDISDIHKNYMNNYDDDNDSNILIERISTRIKESNQIPYYYRQNVSKEYAIKLLYNNE